MWPGSSSGHGMPCLPRRSDRTRRSRLVSGLQRLGHPGRSRRFPRVLISWRSHARQDPPRIDITETCIPGLDAARGRSRHVSHTNPRIEPADRNGGARGGAGRRPVRPVYWRELRRQLRPSAFGRDRRRAPELGGSLAYMGGGVLGLEADIANSRTSSARPTSAAAAF